MAHQLFPKSCIWAFKLRHLLILIKHFNMYAVYLDLGFVKLT